MKRQLLFILVALVPMLASAYDALIDGIYYNLNDGTKTAEVTNRTGDERARSYSGFVSIPFNISYDGVTYSVTSIGKSAFSNCDYLTEVSIPGSVKSIGEDAFLFCNKLTSQFIPSSVTTIGEAAFFGCSGLTKLTIQSKVTSIGEAAFSCCSALTSITVKKDNRYYEDMGCNAIIEKSTNKLIAGCNNTIIPSSVTSIGAGAFQNCTGLTSVTLPQSLTSIGESAFGGCTGLKSVEIPKSVTTIGAYAFHDCTGITYIEIPNNVTRIEDGTFKGCTNLIWAYYYYVKSIGDDAFSGCQRLSFTEIYKTVTSIGKRAFSGCKNIYALIIPYSVITIGEEAFRGCTKLTEVTIGESVKSIGRYAFNECLAIKKVVCNVKVPPTVDGFGTFDNENVSDITLYVPLTCKEDYKRWGDINPNNIIEMGTEGKTELELLRATVDELWDRYRAVRDGDINEDGKVNVEDVTKVVKNALKRRY